MIYFVTVSGSPFVKIGYAANVAKRIKGLQTSHPEPVTLIAQADGGFKDELRWHRRFDHLRESGEWFRWGRDLFEAVASEVGFNLTTLDQRFVDLGYFTPEEAAASTRRRWGRMVPAEITRLQEMAR